PERQTYEARSHPNHLNQVLGRQYIAELHFVSAAPNKRNRYLLRWMADAVGAIRFIKIRKGRTLPVSE
ncbi:MAG TPA: hypothetical protein VFX76_12860, partial [Roseiflexaceae bacterium]|nr:hypothetical protein [Roseiflexaceae bacterium]